MAYSRYRRKPRRSYRKSGYKRRSSARPSRYTGRTRRYTRKRPMSKRSVLNTTSRKKRNGMLSWSNTTATGASRAIAQGPAFVGNTGAFFIFCPTAMQLDGASTIANQASRTATTCYMKGFAENIRIQTSSGIPWFHRRVCFTLRGPNPFNVVQPGDTPGNTYPYLDTSNGIERLWLNVQINGTPASQSAMWNILFKGTVQKDWDDLIFAPIDTARVSLKFDKTWTLQSGNNNGVVRDRKLYHPMGPNIVYDDDESGDTEVTSHFSVTVRTEWETIT
uniref:Capsid protein n=1 Tax=Genomoviridae sp. TaxID=2202565 RepID=A0A8F1SZJ3_9VIRU|nr:capsid protein [Genomoviridae sp.]